MSVHRILRMISLAISLNFQATAQHDVELPGIVVEQNSNKKTGQTIYLQGVSIKSSRAAPQLSDAFGRFRLVFADVPFGNTARIDVSKDGYEVVNAKMLEAAAVTGRRDPFEIVMCKRGLLYESQIAYYRIVSDGMQQQYQKRIQILEQGGKNRDDLIAKLQMEMNVQIKSKEDAIKSLQEQYQLQIAQAGAIAKGLATVNLDDESDIYRKAFDAFQSKDIDKAIAWIDSINLDQRLATNSTELKKEESAGATIQQRQNIEWRSKQIKQDISQCMFKARLHILKSDYKTATASYQLAYQYDSLDIANLWEIGSYFLNRKENVLAKKCFDSILALQQLHIDKANTFAELGKMYQHVGNYEESERNYLQAVKVLKPLYEKDTTAIRTVLANALANTGLLYEEMEYYATAEKYLSDADQVFANSYPSTESPLIPDAEKMDWSRVIHDHCELYMKFKNHYAAERYYFNQAIPLLRSFEGEKNDLYHSLLSAESFNCGISEFHIKIYADAGDQLAGAMSLEKMLYQQHPDLYSADWANTLNRMGEIFYELKVFDKAEELWISALKIVRESLSKNSSGQYSADLSAILGNLGLLNQTAKNYSKSEEFYTEALMIQRQLVQKNPVVYLRGLAEILNRMGQLYLRTRNYPKGEKCYSESVGIYKKLADKNPDIYSYDLADAQYNLAKLYDESSDNNNAGQYYMDALKIQTQIIREEKNHVNNEYELNLYLHSINNTITDLNGLQKKGGNIVGADQLLADAKRAYDEADKKMETHSDDLLNDVMGLGKFYFAMEVYPKAEESFAKAREQSIALKKSQPDDGIKDYKQSEIESSLYLLRVYQKELESTKNFSYRDKAIKLLKETQRPDKDDYHQDWRQEMIDMDSYFSGTTKNDLQVSEFIRSVDAADSVIINEENATVRVEKEEQLVKQIESKYAAYPGNGVLKTRLSQAYGRLAWLYIFVRKFQNGLESAQKGLALDPAQKWIYSNLALAYLLEGRWPEAKEIYAKYKEKDDGNGNYFKDIFLKDLSDLREAGIVYPQMRDAEEFLLR